MKKKLVVFITLIIIVVIAGLTIFKLSQNKGKDNDIAVDNIDAEEITDQPTVSPLPTEIPSPTEAVEVDNGLYPAFQLVDNVEKYGYINSAGEFIIPPSFESATDFEDGAAVVYMNNQYSVIDESGSILYTCNGFLEDFHNGAAVFSSYENSKVLYGYIDTTGKVIIEPIYTMASNFNEEGTAYVSLGHGRFELIDKSGKSLDRIKLDTGNGHEVSLQDGYMIYEVGEVFGHYGVISLLGEEIFPANFGEITYLGSDLFSIKKQEDSYDQLMPAPSALFNVKGEQLTDYTLYDVSKFKDGYASATDSTSTYFIDTKGKAVPELPKYEGRGTLILSGDIVKAAIDQDLIYSKKDGTVLWQNDNPQVLSGNLTVKGYKFKSNRFVLVYYPQLEGLADTSLQNQLNIKLKSIFTDNRMGLTEEEYLSVEDNFEVQLLGDLLIVKRTGYDYYFGAAHGMPIRDYFYFDIKTGVSYEFKDLFKADSDYISKINELIHAELAEKEATEDFMIFPDSFTGISENPNFILTKDSVSIYYYPYEIAAYAAGFPEFLISFEDIKEFIDTNSDFWKSFH